MSVVEMEHEAVREPAIIQTAEFDLARLDTWEDYVGAGQAVTMAEDFNRWTLGDIGLRVAGKFSENKVAEFAGLVGTGRATMYSYIRTSKMFDRDDRGNYENCRYGHFQAAATLENRKDSIAFMKECSAYGYSVEKARTLARKQRGAAVGGEVLLSVEGVTVDELISRLMGLAKDRVVRAKVTSAV